MTPKERETKAKIDKWDCIKLNAKEINTKTKGSMRKYLQIVYPIKVWNQKYIKSLYKNQTSWLKNVQRKWIYVFPKMTYRWPTGTWKDTQHQESSGGVSTVAQQDQWHLGSAGTQVWSLARHSRLMILHCLGCNCSTDLILAWGTLMLWGSQKKKKSSGKCKSKPQWDI